MKKTLFKKVEDYANKLLEKCENQKEVSIEEEDGVITLKTYYFDREGYNLVTIKNEKELEQLKREDKRQLAKGYLV